MDKLEKQVSPLPKKDLSKGQRRRLFWLKEALEMNTSLALFLSFSLFVSPTKKLIQRVIISKFISPLVFARAFIILILQHLIDILQH